MGEHTKRHTIEWHDPLATAAAVKEMSGLEALRAMQRGEIPLPPMTLVMNMRLVLVEEGHVVFSGEPGEYHYNPIGSVHGGYASTIFDSALGCAVHSTLPAGDGYTTLDLHVRFIRAITHETGRVRCEARVVNAGSRIAVAEATLYDAGGKVLGHGTTSCFIFRGRG
ncbi:PaaI family thioesterase [bacterium]|nr:MAG: PaaI family thioesterase [bacterium]